MAVREEPRHGLRIGLVWLVASAIAMPLVYFVWGPNMPPGNMSDQANGQRFDNQVLGTVATPVVLLVCIFLIYAVVVWRQDGDAEIVDGPYIKGSVLASGLWVGITAVTVLGLFVFGTYELENNNGAGTGSGPNPLFAPGGKPFPVQVIAQQWRFSFRYPTFGGMETTSLVVPSGVELEFHVTSLDVIHSFWAYQLGVKADANPGVDNIAFVRANRTGAIEVRCAELCGLWHGAMYSSGQVMSQAAFASWGHTTEARLAAVTKLLPKYSTVYAPDEQGAGGAYYGPQYPVSP
jgi:cytochrome c oxidase subunit 2